ncbi:MAG TPA: hypothetical protein VFL80_04110 [Thermoanaerobaculia bacterium]|nr:hypothetical protein [Thermoanaerobaculia bacterium]
MNCQTFDELLLAGDEESMQRAALHARECAACADTLEGWNDISQTAQSLRTSWTSDLLWRRIERTLRAEKRTDWWRVAAAAVLTVGLAAAGWRLTLFDRNQQEMEKTLAKQNALTAVESAEETYVRAIAQLEKLAEPKLEEPEALMVTYREKLMLLDDAIAECEYAIGQNRNNALVRRQLLAVYGEKQRTLQDVLREETNVSNQ